MEKYSEGTAYFKQMKDEFEAVASAGKILSTKALLMDDKQEINRKLNMALKLWKSCPPAKYVIDYICTFLGFTFSDEARTNLYAELFDLTAEKSQPSTSSVNSNTQKQLSSQAMDALTQIACELLEYTEKMLEDSYENCKIYNSKTAPYLDIETIKSAVINPDERFIIDFLAPVTEMPLERIDYFLCHVLKRKSLDFYDKNEFLLYAVTKIDCDSKYGLLCKLHELYDELEKSGEKYTPENADETDDTDEMDDTMTVFLGYYADDTFLDEIDYIECEDVSENETIRNMLLWHIGLERSQPSSAYTKFKELYDEVNELYAEEIADFKILKKIDTEAGSRFSSDADDNSNKKAGANPDKISGENLGKRGEYNVSSKYDGSGEIELNYSIRHNVTLKAGTEIFISEGRFNRVNGSNLFAPCDDIVLDAGEGSTKIKIKCTSENPFQMVKARKNGTVEIAERNTIHFTGDIMNSFDKCEITHKPICTFFNTLKNTGIINDYLFSGADRRDMMDEWFYDKSFLNIDASLLNTQWFNETRLSADAVGDFLTVPENVQRNRILLLLFMKFAKKYDLSNDTVKARSKNFLQFVQYEMGELRFDGISYGNPFDCLLSYLLLSDAPVDNLRLLYKEADAAHAK